MVQLSIKNGRLSSNNHGKPALNCLCAKNKTWAIIYEKNIDWGRPENGSASVYNYQYFWNPDIKLRSGRIPKTPEMSLMLGDSEVWRISGHCPNCKRPFNIYSVLNHPFVICFFGPTGKKNNCFVSLPDHAQLAQPRATPPRGLYVDWIPSPRSDDQFQRLYLNNNRKYDFAYYARYCFRVGLPHSLYPDWSPAGSEADFAEWGQLLSQQYKSRQTELHAQIGLALHSDYSAEENFVSFPALVRQDEANAKVLDAHTMSITPSIREHCRRASLAGKADREASLVKQRADAAR